MPNEVLEEVQQELLDWQGLGLSVMEISHRSEEFIEITRQAELDFRELLSINDDYAVLFLHGGATLQNAMIPLNLSPEGGTADYVNSGYWAIRSINEAKKYGPLEIKILKCGKVKVNNKVDSVAYMQVKDLTKNENEQVFIFNGWTFASDPTLTPFDHAIYDLQLLNCNKA